MSKYQPQYENEPDQFFIFLFKTKYPDLNINDIDKAWQNIREYIFDEVIQGIYNQLEIFEEERNQIEKPERPLSAYLLYVRNAPKDVNPTQSNWDKLSKEEKEPYIKEYDETNKKYEEAKKKYEKLQLTVDCLRGVIKAPHKKYFFYVLSKKEELKIKHGNNYKLMAEEAYNNWKLLSMNEQLSYQVAKTKKRTIFNQKK